MSTITLEDFDTIRFNGVDLTQIKFNNQVVWDRTWEKVPIKWSLFPSSAYGFGGHYPYILLGDYTNDSDPNTRDSMITDYGDFIGADAITQGGIPTSQIENLNDVGVQGLIKEVGRVIDFEQLAYMMIDKMSGSSDFASGQPNEADWNDIINLIDINKVGSALISFYINDAEAKNVMRRFGEVLLPYYIDSSNIYFHIELMSVSTDVPASDRFLIALAIVFHENTSGAVNVQIDGANPPRGRYIKSNAMLKTPGGEAAYNSIKMDNKIVVNMNPDWALDIFGGATWNTIKIISESGQASKYFAVGDEKTIKLSTGEQVTLVILGFDHDDLADGSGKAGITIGMKELLATQYRMNPSYTNVGGWDSSEMRTTTMQTLLGQLPSDLKAVIKSVNKKATSGGTSTTIKTSSDKLFLFSEVEINGTRSSGYVNEGEQYEYWKTVKDGTVGADRIKHLSNGSGSATIWWLRSPYTANNTYFRSISFNGNIGTSQTNLPNGVSFGFCV